MTSFLLRRCSPLLITTTSRLASSTTRQPQHQHTTASAEPEAVPSQQPPSEPYSKVPRTKTVLGLNLDMLRDPFKSSQYMVEQVRLLGPIFKITGLPSRPEMIVTVNPQDVEAVYRNGDMHYPERFPFKEWKQARVELNRPPGLFLEEGEEWHKQRIPISKFIMMPRKMAEYHGPFNKVAEDFVNYLRTRRDRDGISANMAYSLNKWSLESVSLFVLGKRMGCFGEEMPPDCRKIVDNLHTFFELTSKILFGLPLHKFWRTKNWKALVGSVDNMLRIGFDQVNEKVDQLSVQQENCKGEGEDVYAELGTDFLTYMVHSGSMDIQKIAVNAIDLILAGVDTTSLTMCGCFYLLGTNPEVQEKLREEVQRVVGKEAVVTPQHIQDMRYLRDTIKESMRLYPIAPINSRMLKEDVVLSGYSIPAGSIVSMSTFAAGRSPDLFPDPDQFKPERWSRDSNLELPGSFSSLPFGFGRRMCVGRRIAELEMHILLAQMVRNFRIEYREKDPMEFITKLFLYPARKMDLALIDLK